MKLSTFFATIIWCSFHQASATNSGGDGYCFSGSMTVHVFDKGDIPMGDLVLGDIILTGPGQFEPIYAFGRYDKDAFTAYLQIETADEPRKVLDISAEHLLFLKDKQNPVRADSIQVGDILQSGDVNHPHGHVVDKITHVTNTGRFAPLTPDGTLVVNGIVASSYVWIDGMENMTLIQEHVGPFCHFSIAPFRFLCMAFHSSSFCHSYTEDGIPHGLNILMKGFKWIMELGFPFQVLALLLYGLVAAFFSVLEWFMHISPTIDETVVVAAAFLSYNIHFAPIQVKNK